MPRDLQSDRVNKMTSTPPRTSISTERVTYRQWENCWRISNRTIELIVTADVGPRIIYFGHIGGQNLFKNYDDQVGRSGESSWMIRGGSRIWVAPEDPTASYQPDNVPVRIEVQGDTLTATAPIEEAVRLQKQMVIRLAEESAKVEIRHRIRNAGLLPTEFSIWVLTVMAQSGTAVT